VRIRRAIALGFVFCFLSFMLPKPVSAALLPSPWAEMELELARQWGLLGPSADNIETYSADITKDAFTELTVNMCERLLGKSIIEATHVSFHEDNIPSYYYRAFAAGIVNGTGRAADGGIILGREETLSREQIAKMLYQAIVFCHLGEGLEGDIAQASLTEFADFREISDWARTPCAAMTRLGIIKGENDKLLPQKPCTAEQAIVLLTRAYLCFAPREALDAAPLFTSSLSAPQVFFPTRCVPCTRVNEGVTLKWGAVRGATEYLVQVDFPGATSTQRFFTTATKIMLQPQNRSLEGGQLLVSVAALDSGRRVIAPFARLNITVYGTSECCFEFRNSDEASKYMTTVEIKVWDFDETGQKVTKTKKVTVHKWVAYDVAAIFDEIYNGPEHFPIHSVHGYRPGYGGEHPKGTAIDINPNENYEVWNDGRVGVGSFWKPGESPYSIQPNGDVVKAFRSRGWGWGGTDWRTKRDYMHFSYFGT
jgi:hypothetical protein